MRRRGSPKETQYSWNPYGTGPVKDGALGPGGVSLGGYAYHGSMITFVQDIQIPDVPNGVTSDPLLTVLFGWYNPSIPGYGAEQLPNSGLMLLGGLLMWSPNLAKPHPVGDGIKFMLGCIDDADNFNTFCTDYIDFIQGPYPQMPPNGPNGYDWSYQLGMLSPNLWERWQHKMIGRNSNHGSSHFYFNRVAFMIENGGSGDLQNGYLRFVLWGIET